MTTGIDCEEILWGNTNISFVVYVSSIFGRRYYWTWNVCRENMQTKFDDEFGCDVRNRHFCIPNKFTRIWLWRICKHKFWLLIWLCCKYAAFAKINSHETTCLRNVARTQYDGVIGFFLLNYAIFSVTENVWKWLRRKPHRKLDNKFLCVLRKRQFLMAVRWR